MNTERGMYYFSGAGTTSLEDDRLNKFSLYPNPAFDHIQLKTGIEDGPFSVKVYDITGRLALSRDVSRAGNIDISSLRSGMYLFNVTDPDGDRLLLEKVIIR